MCSCSQAIFQNAVEGVKYFKEIGYESTCYGKLFQFQINNNNSKVTIPKSISFFKDVAMMKQLSKKQSEMIYIQSIEELIQAEYVLIPKILSKFWHRMFYLKNYKR